MHEITYIHTMCAQAYDGAYSAFEGKKFLCWKEFCKIGCIIFTTSTGYGILENHVSRRRLDEYNKIAFFFHHYKCFCMQYSNHIFSRDTISHLYEIYLH